MEEVVEGYVGIYRLYRDGSGLVGCAGEGEGCFYRVVFVAVDV